MRGHPDFDTEGLQNLLLNIFYPMNDDFLLHHNGAYIGNYWANWELASLASMISIGVYCDREDIYKQALDYVRAGKGNGSIYHMMPYVFEEEGLAQWQETTRDQGHTTLGVALCGVICETAWNQGDDLYRLSDNRFRKAVEYIVKYNSLGEEVLSAPYEWRKGRDGKGNGIRQSAALPWELASRLHADVQSLCQPHEPGNAKCEEDDGQCRRCIYRGCCRQQLG